MASSNAPEAYIPSAGSGGGSCRSEKVVYVPQNKAEEQLEGMSMNNGLFVSLVCDPTHLP